MYRTLAFALIFACASAQAAPSRRVFGYIYAGTSTTSLPWDLVTDLAFFSEPLATSGTLPVTSWNAQGKAMVTAAHANGVRVELVVQLFNSSGGSEIATFLGSATAVQTATQAIAAAVKNQGADGASLDFEFVPKASKAAFTSFVAGLTAAVHTAVPGSDVSVAMPPVTYPGYDIAGLGAAADTLMIMAYDFHYAGSDPGPVAPLADSTMWGAGSATSAIALFTGLVPDPHKLILGVPLYGYDYQASSSAVPTTHVASTTATAIEWANCPALATMYGRMWDAASSTPYLVYQSAGVWKQLWYEDPQSLGLKIDLVNSSDLGGVGLWNLAYADADFWTVVQDKLVPSPMPDAGVAPDLATAPDLAESPTPSATPTPVPEPADLGVSHAHGGCDVLPHHEGSPLTALVPLLALLWFRRRASPARS